MDQETKKEARKQYFHYFKYWIIAFIIIAVFFVFAAVKNNITGNNVRQNNMAPKERVYDYADVLTDEEEDKLRELIAGKEARIHCDVVLVTIKETIETESVSWENGMMYYADDFYDNNQYGYNQVHGDGILLLDNWQEGQKGSWLSTCGRVYRQFNSSDINDILFKVYDRVETSPYKAYEAYIKETSNKMNHDKALSFFPLLIVVIPILVLIIFVIVNIKPSLGKDTTMANTYVAGGRPRINAQTDTFARKFVTTRKIQTDTGHHGGGSSGHGGGHTSSGGVSHGGGGMRR